MPISQILMSHFGVFVNESHLTSEIPSEIDRKSDPKSHGFARFGNDLCFENETRYQKVKVETVSFIMVPVRAPNSQ